MSTEERIQHFCIGTLYMTNKLYFLSTIEISMNGKSHAPP